MTDRFRRWVISAGSSVGVVLIATVLFLWWWQSGPRPLPPLEADWPATVTTVAGNSTGTTADGRASSGKATLVKEAGVWKAEHDQHNRQLLKRQEVLGAAWKAFQKSGSDDRAAWMKARASALSKAGLDAIFE